MPEPIRIIYRDDHISWTATSPELPGWFAVAPSYLELRNVVDTTVRDAIADAIDDEQLDAPGDLEHYVPAPDADPIDAPTTATHFSR